MPCAFQVCRHESGEPLHECKDTARVLAPARIQERDRHGSRTMRRHDFDQFAAIGQLLDVEARDLNQPDAGTTAELSALFTTARLGSATSCTLPEASMHSQGSSVPLDGDA